MNVTKFTLSCVLTSMVIAIEVFAAAAGEAFSLLTILSALFIYIICRKSITLGIASYISIGIILLLINPHKLIFFIFTNGLLGVTLGFCDKKYKSVSITISGLMLSVGIIIAARIIGVLIIKWYIVISIFIFSSIYTAFFRFIAGKAYEKLVIIEKKSNI